MTLLPLMLMGVKERNEEERGSSFTDHY
jgi:hypothetical protein